VRVLLQTPPPPPPPPLAAALPLLRVPPLSSFSQRMRSNIFFNNKNTQRNL
jgi:hypothetical protein